MIASAGAQSPDVITRQQAALEDSIRRIEADYRSRQAPRREPVRPPAPQPERGRDRPPVTPARRYEEGVPAGNEASLVRPARRPLLVPEPHAPDAPRQASPRPELRHEPELDDYPDEDVQASPYNYYGDEYEDYDRDDDGSPVFRRIIAVLALVAILGVIGWLGYTLFTTVMGSLASWQASEPAPQTRTVDPAEQDTNADASYITVLSPEDTTALEIAGRGKAEIVSQSNMELIRLISLRPAGARDQQAPPILVRLQEGVLPRIAGDRVTVEILAKSGTTAPATFAVGCEFGGQDLCGRKRFKVGIQPEAIVFTINVGADLADAGEAFLTIATDIAPDAALTGEGEPIDVIYARLRLPTE